MNELNNRLRRQSDKRIVGDFIDAESQPELHPARWLMIYLSTVLRLGVINVARVLLYRACKRAGIYRWLLPRRNAAPLAFRVASSPCGAESPVAADRAVLAEAHELLTGKVNYFSAHPHDMGNPPDWFLNPFQNKRHSQCARHWSEIADFDAKVGDIKIIWELSRFSWAPVFARAWRITEDVRYLSALQDWAQDWWQCNPPNTGPNWMCGQEISIRLINVLLALHVVGPENKAAAGLTDFVEAHCHRVDLTKSYAVAQDNNHATSEAAGLFMGGTWLARHGHDAVRARGRRWAKKGRKLLDRSVRQLLLPDGSFSQHSLTYHRLLLDTLSVTEAWRRQAGELPFSGSFYTRAAAATRWLATMIDPTSGDGPNLGTNDGAHPYRLDASTYRDFRSCLQLASLLFTASPALESGPWDESAAWLGIEVKEPRQPWLNDLSSRVFPDGGYVAMRNSAGARVLLRTPTARFRPAHADALHLDLWWKGRNLLRDGGTYCYADGGAVAEALAGAEGHNIPQFDDHDQMPKLGRFLYGAWVQVLGAPSITTNADGQSWTGCYTDVWGAQHMRTITLQVATLLVVDRVQGFNRRAILRWRLTPGNWSVNESGCTSALAGVRVESSVPICRMSLESGWESRHYLEKSNVPVLEVEIAQSPAVLTTTVTLH